MATEKTNAKYFNGNNVEKASTQNDIVAPKMDHPPPAKLKPTYSAFSTGRRRFILGIVTAAGFFGPLAGGIYLPALPTLQQAFGTSATAINATVSVFMGVLAVAVCTHRNTLSRMTKTSLQRVNAKMP